MSGFIQIRPGFISFEWIVVSKLCQSPTIIQEFSLDIYFLQEKIMRVPYGTEKEYFKHSLFLVFCNRITTSAVSAGSLLVRVRKFTATMHV